MSFVDQAKISVQGGNGGKGCESFYRDKFMRYPIPDGGDGGKGGDIVIVADKSLHTLLDFKFKQHFEGERGGHASSSGKKGKRGKDCVLRVPIGTIIRDVDSDFIMRDMTSVDETLIVAKGGIGGIGNKNSKMIKLPKKGEAREIQLELKIIADVGLIGFPNAGKSTLICNISNAHSKIANYPFTTKQPILGIVEADNFKFVIADLPGIIEGAHEGKGLGDRFLKHAERTKILVHVVDMAGSEGRDPLEDYKIINNEIKQYGDILVFKQKFVVANKMDLPEAAENLKRFKKKFKLEDVIPISALEKDGLDKLLEQMKRILC